MPVLKNAKKALRVSKRRYVINRRIKSRIKTTFKKLSIEPTANNLAKVYSAIDKALKKHIFHKNKCARLKAKASRIVKNSKKQN